MANSNKQNRLVRLLPDVKFFRYLVSYVKIAFTMKYALHEEKIKIAEVDVKQKEKVVEECQRKWANQFKWIDTQVNTVFSEIPSYIDMNETELNRIRTDMLFCYFAYGFLPTEYFAFKLEQKSVKERRNFISYRLRQVFRCKMNNLLQAHMFNDKAETYEFYKELYHREAISIETESDFSKFDDFLDRHPVFVKKAVYLAQGESVGLINSEGKDKWEIFQTLIKDGKHIVEEKITQSSAMVAFNESSVNTVRVITFNTRHGIEIPYCTIRTGRPGSFVDNGGAGGIQACIDFNTGTIYTNAFDEIGGIFTQHPASGTVFKGYQMPDWKQLQELCVKAATKVPNIKFIGWDLAHTDKGWILVEGNENCYIIAKQMIDDCGLRDTFENLMSDMDLLV